MRIILQKVTSANVKVENSIISEIHHGFCLLVGISKDFNEENIDWAIDKILKLKCFSKDAKEWNNSHSILDVQGEILVISQFTLHARTNKGSKPDFSKAMDSHNAKKIYEKFVSRLQEKSQLTIKTGIFGAMMNVEIHNDGPYTLILER